MYCSIHSVVCSLCFCSLVAFIFLILVFYCSCLPVFDLIPMCRILTFMNLWMTYIIIVTKWFVSLRAGCSLNVKDFKASWRSGVVFLAILYALRPDLVDLSKARTRSNKQNLEEAFRIAEKELRIPRLLDPDGELFSFTSLTQFRKQWQYSSRTMYSI